MDAAFGLFRPRPTPGADVVAVLDGLGARPAADRGIAELDQRMGRQIEFDAIGLDLVLGPVGEGIELDLLRAFLDHLQPEPVAALEALATGYPALVAVQ